MSAQTMLSRISACKYQSPGKWVRITEEWGDGTQSCRDYVLAWCRHWYGSRPGWRFRITTSWRRPPGFRFRVHDTAVYGRYDPPEEDRP